MSTTPIAEHALLSDRHTAALVSRAGSVDWLCLPRFDAPAVFTRLLDAQAGHFAVHPSGTARITLDVGDRIVLGMAHRSTSEPYPAPMSPAELETALRETVDAWRGWSRLHQGYQGPWRDLVHHGGRVLQALSYQPTGAVVAAPTTSLPEEVGGERNWDYRYSWVRDASFTLDALWVAACPDEAHQFFDYLAQARCVAAPTCRSCSASAASTTSPSASCRTCPAGAPAARSGSATGPGTSVRSTSTASCSAPPTGSSSSSTRTIRAPRRGASS